MIQEHTVLLAFGASLVTWLFTALGAAVVLFFKKEKMLPTKRAVDDVTLTIPHGSFTVLVGPSGCGKTTLLRMIAGLEEITDGRIMMGDIDITNLDPGDRGLAMVFQNYALYPHMTVRENIEFGLVNAWFLP